MRPSRVDLLDRVGDGNPGNGGAMFARGLAGAANQSPARRRAARRRGSERSAARPCARPAPQGRCRRCPAASRRQTPAAQGGRANPREMRDGRVIKFDVVGVNDRQSAGLRRAPSKASKRVGQHGLPATRDIAWDAAGPPRAPRPAATTRIASSDRVIHAARSGFQRGGTGRCPVAFAVPRQFIDAKTQA